MHAKKLNWEFFICLVSLFKTVFSSIVYLIILPVIFLSNFQVEFLFH